MSDLFSNRETKEFFDDFEKHLFDLRVPENSVGFPFETLKRIEQIKAEETKRREANDNHNIQFRKLRSYVEEKMEYGYTFKPQKKKSPAPLKR